MSLQRNANFKDLSSLKFGSLTAMYVDDKKTTPQHIYWLCQCDCGKTRSLQPYQLTSGLVTSCGCQNLKTKKGVIISKNRRLYSLYSSMIARCNNPNSTSYKSYGAKGITVCNEWKEYSAFYKWSMENGYSDNLSIDRIDNSKGYSPQNCRWIPFYDQQKNRTTNVRYTHNGETHIMVEWCKILNFPYSLAKSRRKQAKRENIPPTFDYVFAPKKK